MNEINEMNEHFVLSYIPLHILEQFKLCHQSTASNSEMEI